MDSVDISVEFNWTHLGMLALDETSKLVFPKAPLCPGLYRFDFEDREAPAAYIGQSDQVARRFQHYRTPDPSQKTNIRLNQIMRDRIMSARRISVAIATDGFSIHLRGSCCSFDLVRKLDRVLLEHAAVFSARAAGLAIVNV